MVKNNDESGETGRKSIFIWVAVWLYTHQLYNSTQKLDTERLYTRAALHQITLHQKQLI